jgi:hypothetical protein
MKCIESNSLLDCPESLAPVKRFLLERMYSVLFFHKNQTEGENVMMVRSSIKKIVAAKKKKTIYPQHCF